MEECILFTIQQEQHSGRTQGVKGKAQACVCVSLLLVFIISTIKI